jgi:hypothetical protein
MNPHCNHHHPSPCRTARIRLSTHLYIHSIHFDWDTGTTAKSEKHCLTRALIEAFFCSEPRG